MLGGTEKPPRRARKLVGLAERGLLGFFSKVFSERADKEPGKEEEEEAAGASLVFVLSRSSRPLLGLLLGPAVCR